MIFCANQFICCENKLSGFYMRATLALNGINQSFLTSSSNWVQSGKPVAEFENIQVCKSFLLSNPLKVTSRFQYTVPNLLPANKHGFLKKGGFKFTGITDFIILQRKVIKGKPIYYKTNYLQRTVGVENKICSKSAAKFNNFLVY